jgi:hypothetical protein
MKILILKEKSILYIESIFVAFGIFFLSLVYIGASKFGFHLIALYSSTLINSILLIRSSMNYEEVYKGEILLNCLPIRKEDIVSARYISTLLIAIITTLFFIVNVMVMGFILIGGAELLRILDLKHILLAIISVMFLASIIIPVYYSKQSSMRNYVFIIPLFIVFGRNVLGWFNWNIGGLSLLLNKPLVVVIILGVSLLIYHLSYELSKKIYINKEF